MSGVLFVVPHSHRDGQSPSIPADRIVDITPAHRAGHVRHYPTLPATVTDIYGPPADPIPPPPAGLTPHERRMHVLAQLLTPTTPRYVLLDDRVIPTRLALLVEDDPADLLVLTWTAVDESYESLTGDRADRVHLVMHPVEPILLAPLPNLDGPGSPARVIARAALGLAEIAAATTRARGGRLHQRLPDAPTAPVSPDRWARVLAGRALNSRQNWPPIGFTTPQERIRQRLLQARQARALVTVGAAVLHLAADLNPDLVGDLGTQLLEYTSDVHRVISEELRRGLPPQPPPAAERP